MDFWFVVPPIYYQFKDNGNLPIKNLAIRSNKETPTIDKSEIEILEVLEKVWKHYYEKGAEKLTQIKTPLNLKKQLRQKEHSSIPNGVSQN